MLVSPADRSIALVFPGGPAALAGVKPGEVVVRINGVPIEGMTDEEVSGLLDRFAKEGPNGVVLSLRGQEKSLRSISVLPGKVTLASLPVVRLLTGNIGYLELPAGTSSRMHSEYPQAANDAMASLSSDGVVGWVIDLRRNWGGNPVGMLAAIGCIAGPGVILRTVSKFGVSTWDYKDGQLLLDRRLVAIVDKPVAIAPTVPVAVLVSEVTASAAEAVGISLGCRKNVRFFGRPTYGMTTTTVSVCLRDSAEIIIADGYMADRVGRPYWDGLIPDVHAEIDWARIGSGDDPTLALACRWIEEFDR